MVPIKLTVVLSLSKNVQESFLLPSMKHLTPKDDRLLYAALNGGDSFFQKTYLDAAFSQWRYIF
jgi:hypothetical protein